MIYTPPTLFFKDFSLWVRCRVRASVTSTLSSWSAPWSNRTSAKWFLRVGLKLANTSFQNAPPSICSTGKSSSNRCQKIPLNSPDFKNKNIPLFSQIQAQNAGIYGDEVKQAVSFLHELGMIQHFDNDFLRSRVVINPQWIVDVMACVVSVHNKVRVHFWAVQSMHYLCTLNALYMYF